MGGFPDLGGLFGGVPVPAFSGVRLTTSAKGWVSVAYKDPVQGQAVVFKAPPVAFAIYEARAGSPPSFKISIPAPTLPKVSGISPITGISIPNPPALSGVTIAGVSIPQVSIPRPVQAYWPGGTVVYDNVPAGWVSVDRFMFLTMKQTLWNMMGDWTWANWIRDQVRDFISSAAGKAVGGTSESVADTVVKAINDALDKARTKVNDGLARTTSAVNDGLARTTSAINTGMRNATDQVNAGLGKVTNAINQGLGNVNAALDAYQRSVSDAFASGARASENAINDVLPQLWKLLGLDAGVVGSLAAIRNVRQSSLEVWSPGSGGGGTPTVVHVFAMGAR